MLQVVFFITYYLHRKLEMCKIWRFDIGVAEDSVLLGCYGLAAQDLDCLTLEVEGAMILWHDTDVRYTSSHCVSYQNTWIFWLETTVPLNEKKVLT